MRALLVFLMFTLPAMAQDLSIMRDSGAGYAEVLPGTEIRFPEDHGPHPEFRIEWWYVTANLQGEDGAAYGAQFTLFRTLRAPGAPGAGWADRQSWMGHAAVTSANAHRHEERLARGGIGQAGVEGPPFEAWIDDWEMVSTDPARPFAPLRLRATGPGFAYDLALETDRPMVLQGDRGYSRKSEQGQASHYASQPFFTAKGTIEIDGTAVPVTGMAWMDREWSSQPLAADQPGWDWLSLHLDGGEKLMVYRLRQTDGAHYITGNWIAPDGTTALLPPGSIVMTPQGNEEVAGRNIPVRWRVEVPSRGLAIETVPLNPQAWNGGLFSYWEGPVTFAGSHTGLGYLEMTGY